MSINEHPCTNCGAKDYQLNNSTLALVVPSGLGEPGVLTAHEVVALICKGCGLVSLFSTDFYKPSVLK